jgi:hypothetical protein
LPPEKRLEYRSGDTFAMKSLARVLWVDDNPDREKRAIQLEEATRIKVQFVSVKGRDLQKELPIIRDSPRPGLVIIDHVLNATTSQGWVSLGSTVAGFFRETWPGCPVFGITAARNLGAVDFERHAYDELIDYDIFSTYVRYIPNVIEGFRKCNRVRGVDQWISLLKPPKDEVERIRRCMPHDTKTAFEKNSFANRIYGWFRRRFYMMPGFLYDKDWVATLAGIRKDATDKYLKHFTSALYNGVFDDPDNPRWWKAKLYQLIYAKCQERDAPPRVIQDAATRMLHVREKDQSTCYSCKQKWPDTIAYVDGSDTATREQMHLRCTVAHPLYSYEAMFEEMRVMR